MDPIQNFAKLQTRVYKHHRDSYVKLLGEEGTDYVYKTWRIASMITILSVMLFLIAVGIYQNIHGNNLYLTVFCFVLLITFVIKGDWMIGWVQVAIYKLVPFRSKQEVENFQDKKELESDIPSPRIEPLDMEPIFKKYPLLPTDIKGHIVYPPKNQFAFKYPVPFENIIFQNKVDNLPQTDLIVYVDPESSQNVDECIDYWVSRYMEVYKITPDKRE